MRRWFAALWIALAGAVLSTPLIVSVLIPQSDGKLDNEMRPRATLPAIPHSVKDWRDLSGKIDAYFRDRFGFREEVIHLHAVLLHRLLGAGSPVVEIGNDGWMFLRSDEMVKQSAGLVLRRQRVRETAETIAEVRDVLASKGIKFIFASPPNSATVYPDMLPEWARNQGRQTEYDLMLDALAKRGINAVDLRAPLREAKTQGSVYFQHDTHWSARGSIVGFNSVAAAMGHRDWELDPSIVLGPATKRRGGDLARMLGIAQDVVEWTEPLQLSINPDRASQGASVLVLGNSFTLNFAPFFLANGARFEGLAHERCGFDWKIIEENRPKEVWWMPTERFMLCANNVRPRRMPTLQPATKTPLVLVAK